MKPIQPGILATVPPLARYLTFGLVPEAGPGPALRRLGQLVDPAQTVIGIGRSRSPRTSNPRASTDERPMPITV